MGQTATLAPAVAKDTLFSSPAHQEPSGPAARDRRTARAATNASRPLGPVGGLRPVHKATSWATRLEVGGSLNGPKRLLSSPLISAQT